MTKANLWTLVLACQTTIVCGHPGTLDEKGGHYDALTNTYHYHHELLRAGTKPMQVRGQKKRTVRKVVSGDVLLLENGDEVRLIGVDAPNFTNAHRPQQHFGRQCYEHVKNLVEGKKVGIAVEKGGRSRVGRRLVYVYVGDALLNAELIRKGYAYACSGHEFPYATDFQQLQRQAMQRRAGMWGGGGER